MATLKAMVSSNVRGREGRAVDDEYRHAYAHTVKKPLTSELSEVGTVGSGKSQAQSKVLDVGAVDLVLGVVVLVRTRCRSGTPSWPAPASAALQPRREPPRRALPSWAWRSTGLMRTDAPIPEKMKRRLIAIARIDVLLNVFFILFVNSFVIFFVNTFVMRR